LEICFKGVYISPKERIKLGLFRPISLWPFPENRLNELSSNVKGILVVEQSAGQMVEDVKLAVHNKIRVEHFGKMGGVVVSPSEVFDALKSFIQNK